ncbi:cytidine/deoxycytidylate deaminase family protein [Candidatus Protochlamydia naegleriophila]|uniref:Cytidine/deoxycytidylate deaminase family protein n=1 Tax=Candidatus Protochlamydia naegleriophila TaxID=389348 RepID=A0A0U5CS06_9BACT|nr:nucleoside deaminase [Candidatus Protochlamydia naegleriophila]CUI17788.1 cytidine/deoxycytidylate deaminase family protein [Candidatus Protochlamydia naegleriophila]
MSDYMQLAVDSAYQGIEEDEGGPFGACLVDDKGEVVAVAHNTVLKDHDPTCHAEINCIREACRRLGTHILSDCTLYTTAEPCPMCLAAIYWARIKKVYIGVNRECAARYGFDDAFFYEQLQLPPEGRELSETFDLTSTKACEGVFAKWRQLERRLY